MTVRIRFSGYAHHRKGYHEDRKTPLEQYLIRLQVEGNATIRSDGVTYAISPGDLYLGRKGADYSIDIPPGQDSTDYHIFCDGSWVSEWFNHAGLPVVHNIRLDDKLLSLWRHLSIEQRRPDAGETPDLSVYLFKALLVILKQSVTEGYVSGERPFIVTKMMRSIEELAATRFQVEDVAASVGLSVSRASHLFKEHTGQSMIDYAQEIRLNMAVNQMQYTSMTLEHIADSCGFGSYVYFHRVFKHHYGKSPGQYRKVN
ncbi:helix-turn-helix domain-containing protein [Salisediminibacterium beveridgei]|uniref:Transcriptional regulator (AraC/XylS family) n=1 Tax=Salisediminibacterium beveridgei TaxID=632773 RepID=A0A1D7QZF5_9BACI|nr:AraC family transcriptional regulator [Salisediminibacterium beveridgei]AOM84389.1 transcriptional regulator (AraC/XylS family) [Salisediminibacterium beveridgei]